MNMVSKKDSGKRGCPRGQAYINGSCYRKTEFVVLKYGSVCPNHKGKVPKLFKIKDKNININLF